MNAIWVLLGVAGCGGLGAVARYLLEAVIGRPGRRPYPLGTLIVNVTGSAVLALLAGAAVVGRLPAPALVVLGSGLIGGYTTFSSASQESVELLREDRRLAGLAHGFGTLVAAVGGAAIGLAIGLSL